MFFDYRIKHAAVFKRAVHSLTVKRHHRVRRIAEQKALPPIFHGKHLTVPRFPVGFVKKSSTSVGINGIASGKFFSKNANREFLATDDHGFNTDDFFDLSALSVFLSELICVNLWLKFFPYSLTLLTQNCFRLQTRETECR